MSGMVDGIHLLYEHLAQYDVKLLLQNPEITNISSFQFLTASQTTLVPDCLYVLDPVESLKCEVLQQKANFLVFSEQEALYKDFFSKESNILIVGYVKDKLNVYSAINHCFRALRKLQDHSLELLAAVFDKENPVLSLIKLASKLLGNPVALMDRELGIIESSEYIVTGDPTWDSVVNQKIIPAETKVMQEGSFYTDEYLHNYTYPFFFELEPFIPRICAAVKVNDSYQYIVMVVEAHKKFTQSDCPLLHCITGILSDYMAKNIRNEVSGHIGSIPAFMKQLVDGKFESDEKMILQQADRLGVKLKKYNYLIMVAKKDEENFSYQDILNCLNYISMRTDNIVFSHEYVIMMLVSSEEEILDFSALEIVQNIQKRYAKKFVMSASLSFETIIEVRKSYMQCMTALKLGRNMYGRELLMYGDYAAMHFMREAAQKIAAQEYILPKAYQIMEYDKGNNTDFANTLLQYLKHYKDSSAAAKALSIHRNTVSYRIQRATELFQLDWNNHDALKHLELSFGLIQQNR